MRQWIDLFEGQATNILNYKKAYSIAVPETDQPLIVPSAVENVRLGITQHLEMLGYQPAEFSPLIDWFSKNFLNWCVATADEQPFFIVMPLENWLDVTSDMDDNFEKVPDGVTVGDIMMRLPDWTQSAVVLMPWPGDTFLQLSDDHEHNFMEMTDYLVHLVQTGQRFERMSVPDAIRLSIEWHSRGFTKGDASGDLVMQLPDGMMVVQLKTERALDYESMECHHCIGKGSYDTAVLSGQVQAYSLRTHENKPVVTIAVRGNKVSEMQGYNNTPPAPEYRPYIEAFMKDHGLVFSSDQQRIRNLGA